MPVAMNGSRTNYTYLSTHKPRLPTAFETSLSKSPTSVIRNETKKLGPLTGPTYLFNDALTGAGPATIIASTTPSPYTNRSIGVTTDAPSISPDESTAWWINYTEQTTIAWSERARYCSDARLYQSDSGTLVRSLANVIDTALRCNSTMNLDYGDCFLARQLWLENQFALGDLQRSSYEAASRTFKPTVETFSAVSWSYTQYKTFTFEVDGQKYGSVSFDKILLRTYPSWTYTAQRPDMKPAPSSVQPKQRTCTTGCGACTIRNLDASYLSQVRLLYWPTVTRSISDAASKSMIINDTTYVSPSVYISFGSLSAINSCGLVGKRYTDVLVTLTNAAELSSFSFYWHTSLMTWTDPRETERSSVRTNDIGHVSWTAKAFDYADLEWPYNAQAYSGQQKCVDFHDFSPDYCSIITQPYTPILVIPSQVKEIDPLWATCDYYPVGVEDPPYTLTPVDAPVMAQTLAPEKPTAMSPPTPALAAQPKLAPQTAVSAPRVEPTRAEPPVSNQGSSQSSNTYGIPKASQSWPMPEIILTIGAHEFTVLSKGLIRDDTTTIRAGDPAVLDHSQIISVAPDGKVLAGRLNHISLVGDAGDPGDPNWTPTPTTWVYPSPTMDVGGIIFTRIAESAYLAGNQVLSYGDSAIISETMVHLDSSGAAMMIGRRLIGLDPARDLSRLTPSTSNAPLQSPLPGSITINGVTYVPNAQGAYSINGQTLLPGGTIMNAGTPMVLASDGASIFVGQSVQALNPAPVIPPYLTIGGRVYSADPHGNFLLDGTKLMRGSQLTVSGTVLSLATDGTFAVIGTSTVALLPGPGHSLHLEFKGMRYTADAHGTFMIDGQVLAPGGEITISGTRVSLATDGASAVMGTSTQILDPAITPLPTIVVNGKIYTKDPGGFLVIDGRTVSPGGAITISNTVLSLASDGLAVVMDGSTQRISAQTSESPAIGGLIYSGLDVPLPTDGSGIFFEGTAPGLELRFWSFASLAKVTFIAMLFVTLT